ncbi:MAG: hypothetical protein ACI81R_000396 [Bradymonadia bacterium]|jgi:hypothetical protein
MGRSLHPFVIHHVCVVVKVRDLGVCFLCALDVAIKHRELPTPYELLKAALGAIGFVEQNRFSTPQLRTSWFATASGR